MRRKNVLSELSNKYVIVQSSMRKFDDKNDCDEKTFVAVFEKHLNVRKYFEKWKIKRLEL